MVIPTQVKKKSKEQKASMNKAILIRLYIGILRKKENTTDKRFLNNGAFYHKYRNEENSKYLLFKFNKNKSDWLYDIFKILNILN